MCRDVNTAVMYVMVYVVVPSLEWYGRCCKYSRFAFIDIHVSTYCGDDIGHGGDGVSRSGDGVSPGSDVSDGDGVSRVSDGGDGVSRGSDDGDGGGDDGSIALSLLASFYFKKSLTVLIGSTCI